MATAKKDLEIFVEAIDLDKAVFPGESTRVADFKIVYPRPSIAQKVTTRTITVKDGRCSGFDPGRWVDSILFKEGVHGDFGMQLSISSPVSAKELEAASASAASSLLKILGDLAADAMGIKALNSFADIPANAIAKVLSGSSSSTRIDAVGSVDIPGSVYAGLKGGEETSVTLDIVAERDIIAEKHRSSKSRTTIATRRTIAKKGAAVGSATLRIRAL